MPTSSHPPHRLPTTPSGAGHAPALNFPSSTLPVQPPTVALRLPSSPGGRSWLIGRQPTASWFAPDARALIKGSLPAAIDALACRPEGFLAGLLPYPAHAPNNPDDDLSTPTPASVFLFDQNREADTACPIDGSLSPFHLETPFRPRQSRDGYLSAVRRIKAYLEAGDIYQANLAMRFSARHKGQPWAAFRSIEARIDAPLAGWFDLGDRQILSFSPESFLIGDRQRVRTQPIKGTRRRGSTPAEDQALADALAGSAKDRAENLMIVDLLRNDLGKVCRTGTVRTPELFRIETHPNVHHLVSTIEGELAAGSGFPELLSACFPGGSITGAPKRRAMEIIAELEPVPRDIYCGSLFWMSADGRFGSNIAIRTFLAHEGRLHGWAGAGIVADSVAEDEYQECLDKIAAFIACFEAMN